MSEKPDQPYRPSVADRLGTLSGRIHVDDSRVMPSRYRDPRVTDLIARIDALEREVSDLKDKIASMAYDYDEGRG